MNVIIGYVVLFCVGISAVQELRQRSDFTDRPTGSPWAPATVTDALSPGESGFANEINSTMYHVINHYYCAADNEEEDQVLILYGTKSWTFPVQDVNLTLSYPSAHAESHLSSNDDGYIITAFKVILYIDGVETRGYIIDGGILQDFLKLMFVGSDVSSLSYEFWVYGAPKHTRRDLNQDLNTHYYVCS